MVNFLQLIRIKNLVIIAFILISFKYLVFHSYLNKYIFKVESSFKTLDFILLTLSILLIAAGGYIINDIKDVEADKINKPQKNTISNLNEKKIFNSYLILSGLGIIGALYLANKYGEIQLAFPHILSATLLYMYSHSYKKVLFLGNLIIALLAALVPLTYFLFESYSFLLLQPEVIAKLIAVDVNLSAWNFGPIAFLKSWSFFLALFAFIFTLAREIIKDIEDKEGDLKIKRNTIAIVYGDKMAYWISAVLLTLGSIWAIQKTNDFDINTIVSKSIAWYFVLSLLAPSIWIVYDLYKNKGNAHLYSKIIKYIMLAGISSSILFYSFIN